MVNISTDSKGNDVFRFLRSLFGCIKTEMDSLNELLEEENAYLEEISRQKREEIKRLEEEMNTPEFKATQELIKKLRKY